MSRNRQQKGPFDLGEVIAMMSKGALSLTDFIYDESEQDWVLIMAHKDIQVYFESKKPKTPPPKFKSSFRKRENSNNDLRESQTSNVSNSNYKKSLIDEVRKELGTHHPSLPGLDKENTGVLIPSNLNDAGEEDRTIEIDEKTMDIPIEIDDPTDEITADLASVEKTEQKLFENLNHLQAKETEAENEQEITVAPEPTDAEPPQVALEASIEEKKQSNPSLPPHMAEYVEVPSNEAEGVEEQNFKSDQDKIDEKGKELKGAFSNVVDNKYSKKIEQIKKGTGSVKEKALRISKALEEVNDPLLSEWFVLKDHNKYGPYTYKDMLNMLEEKFIYAFDFVWHKSLSNWRRLGDLEAFESETVNKLKHTYMPELTKAYHKRRHKRVNFGHSIMIHDNSKIWKGKSVQIGEGGVGVVMDQAHIIPGQTLYLHFKPGDGVPPFNATCQVVSKKPQQDGKSKKLEVFYGMKFLNISNDIGYLVGSLKKKKIS